MKTGSNSCSVAFDPPYTTVMSSCSDVWCQGFLWGLVSPEPPGFTGWLWDLLDLGQWELQGIHHDTLLLMTLGAPFRCLQLRAGCDVFLWLLAAVGCAGQWNEEEIWKLSGRKSSKTLKKRSYLQTSGPIKQGNKNQRWDKTDLLNFSRGLRLHVPLCTECKIGRDPFLIWVQLFLLLLKNSEMPPECWACVESVLGRTAVCPCFWMRVFSCIEAVVHLPGANLV